MNNWHKEPRMNGFSIRDEYDDYYDGLNLFEDDIDDVELEKQSYKEYINDTSDDYELWLLREAHKKYYREPYKPKTEE